MKRSLEKEIQLAICDYLALKRYFFYRSNNVPVWDQDHFRALPKYTPRGLPDIVVVKGGKYIGLEVKQAKGVVSEAQAETGEQIIRAGGDWRVVRSLDDVMAMGL